MIAVEFDSKLAPLLSERFAGLPNFRLVMADALTTDFCAEILPAPNARLVANLPYNISTAILQRLIAQRACFKEMVVMLQREVVERLLAPAGTTDRVLFRCWWKLIAKRRNSSTSLPVRFGHRRRFGVA